MHNSATVHHMRMQSSALDSSRSQLCNDISTGVVRHQITKQRRLQKVGSYDVLHHSRSAGPFVGRHFLLERHFAREMISVGKARRCPFKAGLPLDLSLWSFLSFLHHGIEKVETHLL